MEYRDISYVPALYKIFDEILVNAADNLQRDSKMKAIKVDIDRSKGRIKVWNDGKGIPIQLHKKYKVFVPELVFGHLLTSDNYDDSERKVTGGRNGYGAKLTNVFSRKFVIETAGGGKKYKQEWTGNMSKKGKPQVTKGSSAASYTSVEFWPDLSKFGMKELE
ncbi:TOP2, partial [Symbiodinium necroappetens]